MRYLNVIIFLLATVYCGVSQDRRFSVEANFGLSANHFVTSYTEYPPPRLTIYKKRLLGTAGQLQLNYYLKNGTSISGGYCRTNNEEERNYDKAFDYVRLKIENFALHHNENIFFVKHQRRLGKLLNYHLGLYYVRFEQQEIAINEPINNGVAVIVIDERDTPNNRLNDIGFLGGLDYEKHIDSRFKAGLHLTGYWILSGSYYEATNLTGSIAYQF